MLKVIRKCEYCGAEMESLRSTKRFCLEACRKRAERGGIERQVENRLLVERLKKLGLIAKIYPVYSWDTSPSVFALMVPTQAALEELNLNLSDAQVTESKLERALRNCGVETSSAGERLRREIKAFYDGRKDRRIEKGYTPSDSLNSDP